jgi:Pyruvate/2-oxoacid:ferredoxin oxidoreductase delta subunit
MDVESFVSGQLLEIILIFFAAGLLFRSGSFMISIIKSNKFKQLKWKHGLKTVGRSFLPLHRTFKSMPVYTLFRYLFHICLFAVPIFFYGHIVLWESSWLQLSIPPIPDWLADWMTIIFIILSLVLLVRRVSRPDLRRSSTAGDYLLIAIGATTFLSGYFLTHGTLNSIPFFMRNMQTIHIINGEALIILAVFLFIRSRLDREKCTGCAACETNCPTGTLESRETGSRRSFFYSHTLCISCGACVNACPEHAATLRHQINPKRLFHFFSKREIRSVELKECHRCGSLFAPEPLVEQIREKIPEEYIYFCPKCRMIQSAEVFHRQDPWAKKLKT